jgi:hypothetical protein
VAKCVMERSACEAVTLVAALVCGDLVAGPGQHSDFSSFPTGSWTQVTQRAAVICPYQSHVSHTLHEGLFGARLEPSFCCWEHATARALFCRAQGTWTWLYMVGLPWQYAQQPVLHKYNLVTI